MAVTRDELAILQRFREAGGRRAYESIFAAFKDRAYALAYIVLLSERDALDVVRDTFAEGYTALSRGSSGDSGILWLYHSILAGCNRLLRTRNDTPLEADAGLYLTEAAKAPANASQKPDTLARQRLLLSCVVKLPAPQRACVMLYHFNDMTISEIAAVMGCPQSSVKSWLNYARQALRRMLGVDEKDERALGAFAALLLLLPKASVRPTWLSIEGLLFPTAPVAAKSAAAGAFSFTATGALSVVAAVAMLATGLVAFARGFGRVDTDELTRAAEAVLPTAVVTAVVQPTAVSGTVFVRPDDAAQALTLEDPEDLVPLDAPPTAAPEPAPAIHEAQSASFSIGFTASYGLPPLVLGEQDLTPHLQALGEHSVESFFQRVARLGADIAFAELGGNRASILSATMTDWYSGAQAPLMVGGVRSGERLERAFELYGRDAATVTRDGKQMIYAYTGEDGSALRLTVAYINSDTESPETFDTRLCSLVIKKVELAAGR